MDHPRLRGLLDVFPDNKVIEEVHNGLRNDQKKTRSGDRSLGRLQFCAVSTPVLESRKIPHAAKVTREHFVRHFRAMRATSGVKRHYSAKHRMKEAWAYIMGARSWSAISEQASRRSIAAWQWYLEGYPRAKTLAHTQGREPPGLEAALLSGLLGPHQVVQNMTNQTVSASLGHVTYAVLLYPIEIVQEDSEGLKTMRLRGPPSTVSFDYIWDPADWQVLPYKANRHLEYGLVLEQTGPPEPLARAALRRPADLSHRTCVAWAIHLGLNPNNQSIQTILRMIAESVASGDEAYVQQVMCTTLEPEPVHMVSLMQDPVFEAAYAEMPEEEQREFPELRRAQIKAKVRRHVAGRRCEAAKRKREKREAGEGRQGQGRRPLPKRRVRARRGAHPDEVAEVGMGPAPAGESAAAPAPIAAPASLAAVVASALPAAAAEPAVPAPLAAVVASALPAAAAEPAAPAPLAAVVASALPAAAAEPRALARVPRGVAWDRHGKFWIASTHRQGEFIVVTVTCLLHRHDGERCNKSLSLGSEFTEVEATSRIQEWCARGLEIPDRAGARTMHMNLNPRRWGAAEIRPTAELLALVNH